LGRKELLLVSGSAGSSTGSGLLSRLIGSAAGCGFLSGLIGSAAGCGLIGGAASCFRGFLVLFVPPKQIRKCHFYYLHIVFIERFARCNYNYTNIFPANKYALIYWDTHLFVTFEEKRNFQP
jgi:hypothetical protein